MTMTDTSFDSDDEVPILQNLDEGSEADDDVGRPPSSTAAPQSPRDPLPPVPVTILTGFLGSGKTTLVRHILASPRHGKRIAVIENEFGGGEGEGGDEGLSVETMIARDGTDGMSNLADLIELPNGCVCCTVKDSLVETLEALLARRDDLDYVIIEASGMADPGPVASVFWLDDALGSRLRLDGIVACVDARNIAYQLESTSSAVRHDGGGGDEAARQIAFADRIIVNKVDLLEHPNGDEGATSSAAIDEVLRQIESINPTAPMRTTTYSAIEDLEWILDAKCFDAGRARDVEAEFQRSVDRGHTVRGAAPQLQIAKTKGMRCGNPSCIGDHAPEEVLLCGLCCTSSLPPPALYHKHTNAVGTIALFGAGSVDLRRMNTWLASTLWPDQDVSDRVLRERLEGGPSQPKGHGPKTYIADRDSKQTLYRMKGILSVQHAMGGVGVTVSNAWMDDRDDVDHNGTSVNGGLDARRFVVQAVNDLWDVLPASRGLDWDPAETRCCKVIVIGKRLDEDKLRRGFEECFVS